MSRLGRGVAGVAAFGLAAALSVPTAGGVAEAKQAGGSGTTTTPIKHLVVIFQENVSFDHYFGTYPKAANTSGQPFHAVAPDADRQRSGQHARAPAGTGNLLTNNPNRDAAGNQVNPRRLDPANINDVLTCDQDHNYNDEQKAFDGGAMDKFVTTVGNGVREEPDRAGRARRATL